MEGCHWPFRKCAPRQRPQLLKLLLTGRPVKAGEAVGWLIDSAGPLPDALKTAWAIATHGDHGLTMRPVETGALTGVADGSMGEFAGSGNEAGVRAILENIRASCGATLAEALEVQARHSAGFMTSAACRKGAIGAASARTLTV
jgi:enoyl-CoA hydratase/carnithine racemase